MSVACGPHPRPLSRPPTRTIHPSKTRLCYAREESFDFLGYTFGPARHWRTGKRFITAQPSKKARKKLKEKVNALLHRGNPSRPGRTYLDRDAEIRFELLNRTQ